MGRGTLLCWGVSVCVASEWVGLQQGLHGIEVLLMRWERPGMGSSSRRTIMGEVPPVCLGHGRHTGARAMPPRGSVEVLASAGGTQSGEEGESAQRVALRQHATGADRSRHARPAPALVLGHWSRQPTDTVTRPCCLGSGGLRIRPMTRRPTSRLTPQTACRAL